MCAHLSRQGPVAASEPLLTAPPECCAPQPQPAQVLRPRGECQGRCVDRGRAGVSEAETTKDDGVCVTGHTCPGDEPGHPKALQAVPQMPPNSGSQGE